MQSCGKPKSQKFTSGKKTGDPNGVMDDLYYKDLDFVFMKTPTDNWGLVGTFEHHGNDTINREEAEKYMPCLGKVSFSNTLF